MAGEGLIGVLRVEDHAMIGPGNARPVSTANGIAGSRPPRPGGRNDRQDDRHPSGGDEAAVACHRAMPPAISVGRSGVADIAWKALLHKKPSITGHIASWATTIIAVVAISAGAR